MALFKLKTGVLGGQADGSYWKITQLYVDARGSGLRSVTLVIGLFKDKAASDAGAPALIEKRTSFAVDPAGLNAAGFVSLCYTTIKSQAETLIVDEAGNETYQDPDLAGATDV